MNAEKQFQEMPSRVLRPKGGGPSIQDFRSESVRLAQLKRGIIQRMAVMAVNNMDEQEDLLVWNNMEHATAAAPGAVGDLGVHKVWNQLHENEEIRLVEHGGENNSKNKKLEFNKKLIGNVSAKQIVESMVNEPNELKKKKLMGNKIILQSCYAASNGLIDQIQLLLSIYGYEGFVVEGRTGMAFGFKGMNKQEGETERQIMNEEVTTNWFGDVLYDWLIAYFKEEEGKSGRKIFITADEQGELIDQLQYRKPWDVIPVEKMREAVAEGDDIDNPQEIWKRLSSEKKMEFVADEMEYYWQKISEIIGNFGGFKSEFVGKRMVV